MTLTAPRVEDLMPTSLGGGLGADDVAPDLAPLVDQLTGRVGDAALVGIGAIERDVPERATARVRVLTSPTGWPAWKRPVRLLRRPEQLSRVVALLPDHPPRRFVW